MRSCEGGAFQAHRVNSLTVIAYGIGKAQTPLIRSFVVDLLYCVQHVVDLWWVSWICCICRECCGFVVGVLYLT